MPTTEHEYRERLRQALEQEDALQPGHIPERLREPDDDAEPPGADIVRPGECPRCLARGTTNYNGTAILCPDCFGTGARRRNLYEGFPVHAGTRRTIGELEWDGDAEDWTIRVYDGETRPPYLGEVRDAAADSEPDCDAP